MDDDLKILVLGDEDSQEELIEYELSKSNLRFTSLHVTSRGAFLQALQESSPDLILVATRQTQIGGLTALALAQEFCPGTPCFFISPSGRQKRTAEGQEDREGESGRRVYVENLEAAIANFFSATGVSSSVCDKPEPPLKIQGTLQPFMQVAGVIIAFLSPDGRVLEFNQGGERLTGWRRDEILGQDGIELLFPGPYQASAIAHLQRVLSGNSAESIDLPLNVRQGMNLSYRWYCNLVSDGLGQPAGIMLVGQLLSASKLLESLPRTHPARTCCSPVRGRGPRIRRMGSC